MSGDDRPSAAESRREAMLWLAIVDEDIDVARAAPRLGAAAYHLQQAAEKLVKALLVLAGEPFRRTHDLDDLVTQLAPRYPAWRDTLDSFRSMTPWGIAFRYPGLEDEPEPRPSREEIERTADRLAAFAIQVGDTIGRD